MGSVPLRGRQGAEMSRHGLRPQGVHHLVRERDTNRKTLAGAAK